jgi:hypothetical protein
MQCHGFTPYRDTPVWTHRLTAVCLTLVLLLTPCMFYVRYTGPFDSTVHPMPAKTR